MSRKKTVQDFQFGSRLGEGSYSQVYKAVDVSSRKVFAIKVLSKKHIVKEKKIKYVNIEKITLNRLGRHPGIVTLYYTFQDETSLYFVIDLAEYGELLTLIRKLGSLSENCAKYYMVQIIDAIDFMHKKGVIHRDLKPENILLNGDMKIMITDFGAAKILDLDEQGKVIENEEAFAKGSFVGTAEYVSPELLKHNKCGFESDVWAIGCILYQFIVGVPPFKGKTEYLTFEKIVNLQYQWPNYFIPELIKDLVSKMLMGNPFDRLTVPQIQQHPWFSRLNWDDKPKIWGVPPPKMDPYRPLVEQQLQQSTQQMGKLVLQKKLPASTVKKQLLNSTISQIRGDSGNNYFYNGIRNESPRAQAPPIQTQFQPPAKINGSTDSPSASPTGQQSPSRPRVPQQATPVSPHARPQIPTPQQFTPPRQTYQQQQQNGSPRMAQQPPMAFSQPRPFAPSPQSSPSALRQQTSLPQMQQSTQTPTKLKAPVVVQPTKSPAVNGSKPEVVQPSAVPGTPPKPLQHLAPPPVAKPPPQVVKPSVPQVKPPMKQPAKSTSTGKPQQLASKPVSKPPQLALPPKPKSQPPKLQPPSIVTKSNVNKPLPPKKSSPSPISSPRVPPTSNGITKGPTEVVRRLGKDEHIVKLDYINFSELDFASIRTFDPSSSLSQLNRGIGLDDVLIHEIITRNRHELMNGTRRVVLVITDRGNLFLFKCTNVQQLSFHMGIDLTDKLFAMYDYEFSESGESGYLILEVLKMDKLVFLSPLEKEVKRDLMEVATIQQGTDLSWIEALMKTKELLKKNSSTASSTPSPKTANGTRAPTPPSSASSSAPPKSAPITKKPSTSSMKKATKPKTIQQIQQQNRKFAGGAAAAAFKSAR